MIVSIVCSATVTISNCYVALAIRSSRWKKLKYIRLVELRIKIMTNKNFNLFNDITNPDLRAWNRLAMAFNIGKDHDTEVMAEYAAKIPESERHELTAMSKRIQENGYENTKREVMR